MGHIWRTWVAALLAALGSVQTRGATLEEHQAWDECVVQKLASCDDILFVVNAPLTGTIPTEIGSATHLTKIELQDNSISGTIPSEIGEITLLEHLDLHSNKLNGTIPTEIGLLTGLTALLLHENMLLGKLPTELALLTKLQILGLLENQLSGSVSADLTELTAMQRIGVDFNMITGTLPTELGNLKELLMLNAVYNSLSGTIPTELGALPKLETLMLGRNHLTGKVPTELGVLSALAVLHLSVNSLTGQLPTEIGALETLNFEGCELGYPGYDKPQNQFKLPIPLEVQARCVTDGGTAVPHKQEGHLTCGMCMRHRCTSWGLNKCATRKGYKDPEAGDRELCMCGCCGEQCAINHANCALHARREAEAAAHARHAESPLVLLVGALVAGVGLTAVVAARLTRRRS